MARAPKQIVDPTSLEQALGGLQMRIDQLQASLAQQQKLATLGMITAVIAHEFNNILTPMISYTKYALSDKADQAMKEKALAKAMAGAERAANISKSLLGFARGDDSIGVEIKRAVVETLGCLSRDLSKDGITLTMEIPEGLCAAMNGGHLQQVLMNLIVNARSAMLAQRGGVRRLGIKAETRGRNVVISVADSGPGIEAEVLARIFEPFFSTKVKDAEAGGDDLPRGGTGLGLTICRDLVEACGGKISATSAVGKGATFVIEVPVGEVEKPLNS